MGAYLQLKLILIMKMFHKELVLVRLVQQIELGLAPKAIVGKRNGINATWSKIFASGLSPRRTTM